MAIDDLVPEFGRAGLQPRVTSTVRTRSEQGRLYRRFLAGAAGYPVAPPGFSAHEYGEAFDLVVTPMEALGDVGATWLDWGGYWGPGDAVHFELPGATARAKQRGRESPWYVELAAGLPFGIPLSLVLSFLGIPSSARTSISPDQERYLRELAASQGLGR